MQHDSLPDTQYIDDQEQDSDSNSYRIDDSRPSVNSLPREGRRSASNHAVPLEGQNSPARRQERVPLNETTKNSLRRSKMSFGTSKGGSTQEFSQGFFEVITSPELYEGAKKEGKAAAAADENAPLDRGVGKPEHVNQLEVKTPQKAKDGENDQMEEEVEDSEDDLALMPPNMAASQFPEEKRFQAPKTPATRGTKRTRSGDVVPTSGSGSVTASTPKLPVNPFTHGGPTHPSRMSLSQVFNATQAPSSPMLNVPTSDGVSERPSPNMWDVPSAAVGLDSSPAKAQRHRLSRSRTEPHGNYVSMLTSQEERERRHSPPVAVVDLNHESDEIFDNISAPGSIASHRYFETTRHPFISKSRRNIGLISGRVPEPNNVRRKTRTRSNEIANESDSDAAHVTEGWIRNSGIESLRTSPLLNRQELAAGHTDGDENIEGAHGSSSSPRQGDVANTALDYDLDGEETQRETPNKESDNEKDDDVAENDKENLLEPVQVPRTVTKKSRHIFVPAAEPLNGDVGLPPYQTESQQIAVANSQPTELLNEHQHEVDPQLSKPAKASQSRVPDSTQIAPDTVKGQRHDERLNVPGRSQQTTTPPMSSPSPQKTTLAKPTHVDTRAKSPVSPDNDDNGEQDPTSDDVLTSPRVSQDSPVSDRNRGPTSNVSGSNRISREQVSESKQGSIALPATVPESRSVGLRIDEMHDHDEVENLANASTNAANRHSGASPRSPDSTRRRKPRKFADIISQELSQSPGLDFDVSALTHDDEEFKRAIRASPLSSPVRPRKRVRRFGDRGDIPELTTSSHPSMSAPQSSGLETTALYQTANTRQAGVAGNQRIPNSSGQRSINSEKDQLFIAKEKRPIIDSTPDTDNDVSAPHSTRTRNKTAFAEQPAKQVSKRMRPRESPPATLSQDAGSTNQGDSFSIESAIAPYRVWAYFNGSPSGFYPATCLGISESNRLRVRFDDDKEDTVPMASVRRLELKVGDTVKVDGGPGNRNHNTCVIKEVLDKVDTLPTSDMSVSTDVHGWSKLRLAIKKKDGQLEPLNEPVPLSSIYLTQTLFNSMRGRDHIPTSFASEEIATLSPSIYASLPDTPVSKKRRGRATLKKDSSVLQSFKSSVVKSGIFTGMAFAVTSIDKSKRSELMSSIEAQGGQLLTDGLDSVFDIPDEHLTQSSDENSKLSFGLKPQYSSVGFTALIAEKHVRTTNYLHALALNVPCVSFYWLRACVEQGRLLDWRHYLLPSGESQLLEGAVVSRYLSVPTSYSSSKTCVEWPLSSMFEARAKPLKGQNILIVSNAITQKTMNAHLFIAYSLGSNRVCMAQGWKEANDYLEDGKTRWDWICAPEELNSSGRGRKRKNAPDTSNELEIGWKDGVKVVKPEFFVQSLVFGKLVGN